MDGQELIWVDKEFAEKYKAFEQEQNQHELQAKALDEYLSGLTQKSVDDFKCHLESIEEEAAIYAGLMLKVRQAFGKAKDTALDASYAIWEEFDKEMPNIDKKISHITNSLNPLCSKLNEINTMMSKISTYDFDKLIRSIHAISELNIKGQKIMEFVIDNFMGSKKG